MTLLDELTEITCGNVVCMAAQILSARTMQADEAARFMMGLVEDESIAVLNRSTFEPVDRETSLAYEKWLCALNSNTRINLLDCIRWICNERGLAAGLDPMDKEDDCVSLDQVMSFVCPV